MATQQTARNMVAGPTPDLGKLADPIERLAGIFADLGGELGEFGAQLRELRADAEKPGEKATTGEGNDMTGQDTQPERTGTPPEHPPKQRQPVPDKLPPPTAAVDTGPAPLPGEPVDTSFAEPTQTPAAQAAGAAPYQGADAERGRIGGEGSTEHRAPAGDQLPAASAAEDGPTGDHVLADAPARADDRAFSDEWLPENRAPSLDPVPQRAGVLDVIANWTARQGTRVLAWAGAAITLLGVVLLMVMAVQQGWIGPLGRIAAGGGLGLALLASGVWVRRRSAPAAAFSLAATGIAALYLDVLAATALYRFLPAPAGLGAALALSVAGLWLADRWRSQALAVGVVLGCALCAPLLCAPLLFGPVPAATALLTGFLVVLKIAATPVQLRRGWRGLTAASAFPAILAALISDGLALSAREPWTAAWAALAVSVTGLALAAATAHRRGKDPIGIALLISAAAPTALVAPMLGRWPAFGFLALLGALYFAVWCAGRVGRLPAAFGVVAGGVSAMLLFQLTVLCTGASARSVSVLAEALLLAMLAFRLRGKGLLLSAALFGSAGTLLALLIDVPPSLFTGFPAQPYFDDGRALTPAMLGGLAAFLLIAGATTATTWAAVRMNVLPRTPQALTPAAVGLLYGCGGAVLTASLLVLPTTSGFLAGHALITVSWMVLAFLLLLRGIGSVPPRVAGFALVGVALAKLLLFDLAALSGLARVLAFLAAGLILLAGGTRYARLIGGREARAGIAS